MKTRILFSSLALLIIYLFASYSLYAQDLSGYEIVDNDSVGLTVAPFEKWGMAVHDIDRNGYPDIFCVRWKSPGYSRIYINNNAHFQDITNQTPLQEIESQETNTRGAIWVDYDNDGDRDLALSTDKEIHLLRNDNNVFTEVSAEMGFVGQKPPGLISDWSYHTQGWADYDLDGDLDCAVLQTNNETPYLFRNDGDQFIDVASEAGLDSTANVFASRSTWVDIDLDGDQDLCGKKTVFRNDDGVFTEITQELGLDQVQDVGWREFFDYDNDGDWDYFKAVTSGNAVTTNELWENRDGVFVNVTDDVGLLLIRDRYRNMTIGDFDNDGDEDIFVQVNIDQSLDVLLINDLVEPGARAFADVAEFIGITKTGDRKGSAFFDYDVDGFLDIYVPSAEHNHILYHNLTTDANWAGFILEGTVSNRDAVGSLIKLYTAEKTQMRYTKCGNGFVRQDNPYVHFGLGFETAIDSVVITWPLGDKQVLTDVAINQYHEVKEPEVTGVESKELTHPLPNSYQLDQNYPNPFNSNTKITYTLLNQSNAELVIYDLNGQQIITLVDQLHKAGAYTAVWDGRDQFGNPVSTGMYIYRLRAGDFVQSRKLMYVK